MAARGTLAAAAEALFMTPSAMSQQMAVLEREAGVTLLERSGRGVRLTTAGTRLVINTESILAAIEHAEADLVDSARGIVGHVHVSAFPTGARSVVIPALVALREQHPNLRVSMVDLEPEEALPALKARELDVVLTYEWDVLPALIDAGVEREGMFTEKVFLALPLEHPAARRGGPVAVAELADEEWIVGRDSTSMLDLVKAASHSEGFEPRTSFYSMDFQVILAAVEAGLGVALIPPLALASGTPAVAIRAIADLELNRTIWASLRRGSGSNPGIAAVLEALRTQSDRVARDLPTPDEAEPSER